MRGPLVSVLTPYFEDAETLPYAFASLKAQSYVDWEWILIDDGSRQPPKVESPGLRLLRHDQNRGRGYAQQRALEESKGDYVTVLDADDWYYPDKLWDQVEYLEKFPEIAAVAVGMALVEKEGRLEGVSLPKPGRFPFGPEDQPRFPLAPTMIRAGLARQHGFDRTFRRGQDFDFFRRALAHQTYAVLPKIGYVYRYQRGTSARVVLEGLTYTRRALLKKRGYRSQVQWMVCWLKTLAYWFLDRCGLWSTLRQARLTSPTPEQRRDYEKAWSEVSASLRLQS